jgi:hypothetical protein
VAESGFDFWFLVAFYYTAAGRFLVTAFKFPIQTWSFSTQSQKYLLPQKDAAVKLTVVDFNNFIVPEGRS